MTDRIVKVLEDNRFVTRGVQQRSRDLILEVDEDETLKVTFDWSSWLGSDTIASVTNEVSGPTLSGASNTTTQASFKVSGGPGLIEHRITTTTGGETKEVRLWVSSPLANASDDYGFTTREVV